MRTRMHPSTEALDMHARSLAPLSLGDKVFLQNQRGSHPKKWDKSGHAWSWATTTNTG